MSNNFTPSELAEVSTAMKAAGHLSFQEFLAVTNLGLKCYYYTFGTDPGFPYKNGWVLVVAHNWNEAHMKFRARFPDKHEGIINCAFFYDAQHWSELNPEKTWPPYACTLHEIIA